MSDLLADFLPIGQFAKNVRKNIRTIYRWMDEPRRLAVFPPWQSATDPRTDRARMAHDAYAATSAP
jgi:hypothetical protein